MTLDAGTTAAAPILSLQQASKHFGIMRGVIKRRQVGAVQAVDGVSLDIGRNETVGLVGESGCGKSTLARLIMRLETPSAGHAYFHGSDIFGLEGPALKDYRQGVQMVFQDPYSSLNPRVTIGRSIMRAWESNPGKLPKSQWRERARELLQQVGLGADRIDWYPHQLSGGQRQRVAIARALALEPQLVVCDEPVSALDVSIQAQILALLDRLQKQFNISYLFISHDLDVVHRIAHRVVVMYLGRIVESGTAADVFDKPAHPYTEALLAAVPQTDPAKRSLARRRLLQGDPPNPANPPSGCRFRTRCPKAQQVCSEMDPMLTGVGGTNHMAACHFPNLG
ncbi:MAG TPA: ABC transporter ATP-binding protein [Devosiaceae bacterium]|jgi:oligopeptide/dipeptide ABC transporter ATP-binding protein